MILKRVAYFIQSGEGCRKMVKDSLLFLAAIKNNMRIQISQIDLGDE